MQEVVPVFSPIKPPRFFSKNNIAVIETLSKPKQFVAPAGLANSRDIRDCVGLGYDQESLESLTTSTNDLTRRTDGVEWIADGNVPFKTNLGDDGDNGILLMNGVLGAIEDDRTSRQIVVANCTEESRHVADEGGSAIEGKRYSNISAVFGTPAPSPSLSHDKNFRTGLVLLDSPKSANGNTQLEVAENLMTASKKCSPRRVSLPEPEPEPLSSDTVDVFEPCGIVTGEDDISVFGANLTTDEDVDLYDMFVQTGFLPAETSAL